MKIVPMSAKLMAYTVGADESLKTMEQVIEFAGRICYKSEDRITDESSKDFVEKRMRERHLSIIEHCSVTIHMVMDRGISHELVRHRIAAYSQESTRWINYKEGITVVQPPDLTPEQEAMWKFACENCERVYRKMIELGCKPQIARSVLPTCLKTEIVSTYNLRQWLHVLTERLPKVCHPQMRFVMGMCHDILREISPTLFNTKELWAIRKEE